jgi:hemerythrin-like domain-containing protein
MSQPLHSLKHEHRVIERVLRALEGMCLRLQAGGEVPTESLADVVNFISAFADRFHHRKEEDYLFPALHLRGITREGGPLGAMEQEHEIERNLLGELRQAIAAFSDGNEVAVQLFVEDSRRFTELLTRHIELEDQMLFRLADEVLDDDDKKSIGQAFREAEAELGPDGVEKYERMASDLERAWAI